jgi:hypothetical protein
VKLLPDGVYKARFTMEKAVEMWQRSRTMQSLGILDVASFVSWILSPSTVVLETAEGWIIFHSLEPGFCADLMVSFEDHKLSERTGLIRDCLLWAFTSLDLHRISIRVPSSFRAYVRWAEEKLGFTNEGTLRAHRMMEGKPVNFTSLSLLSGEVL